MNVDKAIAIMSVKISLWATLNNTNPYFISFYFLRHKCAFTILLGMIVSEVTLRVKLFFVDVDDYSVFDDFSASRCFFAKTRID